MDIPPDTIDTSLNISTQLAKYLKAQDYFETLLLDMLRDNTLSKRDYDNMMSDRLAAYTQFKNDLLTPHNLPT
ncbi:MAG: hypothetical protein WCL18_07835 [bacterium]